LAGGGAEKEIAKRDEKAFALIAQKLALREKTQAGMENLTANMTDSCTPTEVRDRITTIVKLTDHANAIGPITTKNTEGQLFYRYLSRLKMIRNQLDFDIPYVNALLSCLETCLQMCAGNLSNWEYVMSGKAIEASLENTTLYVERANVKLNQNNDETSKDETEDEEL
jgi:hypothetical protein